MDNIYLDGTLSISRLDYPQLVQVTAWKGKESRLSKWLDAKIGTGLSSAARATSNEDCIVLSVGPNRWLIDCDGDTDLIAKFDDSLGTVLDLSSARTLFSLRGDNLAWLLNKGTAVDLSDTVSPDGSVIMTTIDHIGVMIHKIGQDAFDLYTFSSFGDAMEHWLSTASNDLNFES